MPVDSDGPQVLREILATPAFRELIELHTAGPGPEAGRRAVEALFRAGPELSLGLVASSAETVDAAAAGALELGDQIAGLPAPLRAAFLDSLIASLDRGQLGRLPEVWGPLLLPLLPQLIAGAAAAVERLATSLGEDDDGIESFRKMVTELDGAALGRAVTAAAELVIRVRQGAPELDGGALEAGVRAADFGKIRYAAAALSGWSRAAGQAFGEAALDDPVVTANLVVALPSLINDQLALTAVLIDRLRSKLPEEILASATFALIEDLDGEALGGLMTSAARLVGGLHQGSLVLGSTEPAFRAVLSDLVEAIGRGIDAGAVARALVALGEDGQTALRVVTDLVRRDPSLLPRATRGALAAGAPVVGGVVDLLREVNRSSPEAFAELIGELNEGLERDELIAVARELATLGRRLVEADGEGELRSTAAAVLAAASREAAGAAPVRRALEPEAVGRRLNSALTWFNRAGAAPAEYLERVMAQVEPTELEQAWRTALRLVTGLRGGDGRLARAVLSPLVEAGLRALVLVTWGQRRSKQRGGDGARMTWNATASGS